MFGLACNNTLIAFPSAGPPSRLFDGQCWSPWSATKPAQNRPTSHPPPHPEAQTVRSQTPPNADPLKPGGARSPWFAADPLYQISPRRTENLLANCLAASDLPPLEVVPGPTRCLKGAQVRLKGDALKKGRSDNQFLGR